MMTVNLIAGGNELANNAVLDEFKTVFFCIAKAANSSIKAAILTALGHKVTEDVPHRHAALNLKRADHIADNCEGYDSFVIVRNTFDRLVSCYEQKICTPRVETGSFRRLGLYRDMPFDEFIGIVCRKPSANIHFYPQIAQISHHGQVLAQFVGRFENLAEDWERIRDRCRLPLNELPHYNRSERSNYRNYYTADLRRQVYKSYRAEIEYFGFRF